MKIYGDVISPFVRMSLVTAHEAGLAGRVTLAKTSVNPVQANAELEKLSPIGKIPVLETDHHHPVYDSRVIMEYLAHVGGNSTLIPNDGVKRFRVLTLLALAQGIGDAAVGLRYEQAARPKDKHWPEWAERAQRRVIAGVSEIENNWQDSLGDISVATIALACVLPYIDLRHGVLNWREGNPKVTAFEKSFSQRDSMKAWPIT
jgi:glutathione S-transferase